MQPRLHRRARAQPPRRWRPCATVGADAVQTRQGEGRAQFQAVDTDGVRDALDAHSAAILVSEAVHLAGHQDDAVARQHFARARERAEPGREVQSAAAEAVLCLTASPASSPIPTRIGKEGSSRIASAKRCCRATDARSAWRGESNTQSASSPLSSTVLPPPAPTTSRVSSAKRAVSRAASSSPRSRVNDVYPRMSAIRKARTVAAPATSSNSRRKRS